MILVKKYWKKLESSINLESRDSYSYPDWYTHTCMNNFNVNFYLFLWFDQTKLETFALFWANMKISCFTHTQTHIRQVAFDLVQCVYVCDQSQSRKKSHSKRDYGIPTYDENAKSCFSFVFDWLRGFSWSIVFSSFFIVVRKKTLFFHNNAFTCIWFEFTVKHQQAEKFFAFASISYFISKSKLYCCRFFDVVFSRKNKIHFWYIPIVPSTPHTHTHTHTWNIIIEKIWKGKKQKTLDPHNEYMKKNWK